MVLLHNIDLLHVSAVQTGKFSFILQFEVIMVVTMKNTILMLYIS